jgi:hypothetical protein
MESYPTQFIQRDFVHIQMAGVLETAPIVAEITPRPASEAQQKLLICAGQRQCGMILEPPKADIKVTVSKDPSDRPQFRTVPPNSQPYAAPSRKRQQRLQGNQESILLLERAAQQKASESQVGVDDSEAKAVEVSFFCVDNPCNLAPAANNDNSRHPTLGQRSQEEVGIQQDIIFRQ